MPFYQVDTANKKLQLIKPKTFTNSQWLEREHLQPLFRDNPQSIDPNLFIISEEFTNWENSSRRIDLLALDEEANLVVIELKRVEDGGHMELQALRYAAMISAMDLEDVIHAHEQFLLKLGLDSSNARSDINKFLGLEVEEEGLISNTPRIILIAPSFSQEITTTVLWLNEAGIDIRCMQVNLYNINDSEFLNIEQIIPLPSAEDYQIKIREKTNQAVREASNKQRREKSIKTLIDNNILTDGRRVQLIRSPKSELDFKDIEEKAKYATFEKTSQKFKWDFDEQIYSLSSLCRTICQLYNAPIGAGAFPGPDFWAVEGDDKPLSERAKESLLSNNI
ncbi:hypothetical protein [Calothrix sp. CCY 0018]|uniref:hypothetical protein n=1 Tax=Calothrix sp. CCY 0018 TaxID=3103864 RepID=UPI0039C70F5A